MTNLAVDYAVAQIGKGYQWGGTGPTDFDCSGLVLKAYQKLLITLPHNSGLQAEWFQTRQRLFPNDSYYRGQVRPGDVVFWYGSISSPESISHCGVYVRRPTVLDPRHLVVAAVDEQYGVIQHRMYWALAPVGFGFNH